MKKRLLMTAALLVGGSPSAWASTDVIAIHAGGGAIGDFIADTDYSGGGVKAVSSPINTSNTSNPAPQALYQTHRRADDLIYTIPNLHPNAAYAVRLHFAETTFDAPGLRVFNVTINGARVLNNFDIFKAAGGENVALAQSFQSVADANGKITIKLASTVNQAIVSGIEIQATGPAPAPAPANTVIAIHAGGSAVGSFVADADFSGNSMTASHLNPVDTGGVTNPPPQAVYQHLRYGPDFTYTIPGLTPGSAYAVRLDFVEPYWGKAGQRRFNVAVNGQELLADYDIFAAAGAEFKAISPSFTATANSAGRIILTFTATLDNAIVAGIEIQKGTGSTHSPAPAPSPSPAPAPAPAPSPAHNPAPGPAPAPVPAPGPAPAPSPAPAPAPKPASGGSTVNYPLPFPQWPNALGWKTIINASKAAKHIKAYDAAAVSFYTKGNGSWNPSSFVNVSNGIRGWDSGTNLGVTSGVAFYVASESDPTYTVNCNPGGYCGYSTGMTGVHIPRGARTQNSGSNNCDCHLYLLEPVGWTPGSTQGTKWPNVAPFQYEIDIENAGTSEKCSPGSSLACTTFNNGGSVWGWGIAAFSTGSTGYYGGSYSYNNGFSPANNAPGGWGGSADHSNTPYTAYSITAGDVLQGAINHETGLAMVCLENSQPDNWPSSVGNTDYSCHNSGGSGNARNLNATGWSYGDHIWLNRTPAEIQQDVANGTLTKLQGIYATSLAQYGALLFDTAGAWGPTFVGQTASDPAWNQVASKYRLSKTSANFGGNTLNGTIINLSLPLDYMSKYIHAIDSCVVHGTC